jgi:hypothetical protein
MRRDHRSAATRRTGARDLAAAAALKALSRSLRIVSRRSLDDAYGRPPFLVGDGPEGVAMPAEMVCDGSPGLDHALTTNEPGSPASWTFETCHRGSAESISDVRWRDRPFSVAGATAPVQQNGAALDRLLEAHRAVGPTARAAVRHFEREFGGVHAEKLTVAQQKIGTDGRQETARLSEPVRPSLIETESTLTPPRGKSDDNVRRSRRRHR